jgi:D-serine dehydratase
MLWSDPILSVDCKSAIRPTQPSTDKAILTVGKRDVGYDGGWPLPIAWYRLCEMHSPTTMPPGHVITALNDQHAHLACPKESPLQVGDMVVMGISHPCTTFERWQVLMLVDAQLNIIDAVRTFF